MPAAAHRPPPHRQIAGDHYPVLHRYEGTSYRSADCVALLRRVWQNHRPPVWSAAFDAAHQRDPRGARASASPAAHLQNAIARGILQFDDLPCNLDGALCQDSAGAFHLAAADTFCRHSARILVHTANMRGGARLVPLAAAKKLFRFILFFRPSADFIAARAARSAS